MSCFFTTEMPTLTENDQMMAYCHFRKHVEEVKKQTAGERGELNRLLSDLRGMLLQFLDREACDVLVVSEKLAIKRCVCTSFARLKAETVTEAFEQVYVWRKLQPRLAGGENLPEAVRALLKEEVGTALRRSRQYGDVVEIRSAKFRTRVSIEGNARREKTMRQVPQEVVDVVNELQRCTKQLQQLKAREKSRLEGTQQALKQIEPSVVHTLRRTDTGRSVEYKVIVGNPSPEECAEVVATEVAAEQPVGNYTSLPPPDVPVETRWKHRVTPPSDPSPPSDPQRMRVQYKKQVRRPVLSLAKMDMCVGSELQRYFEQTVCGRRRRQYTAAHQLPTVSLSAISALVEQSINEFVEDGMVERECLSVRTR